MSLLGTRARTLDLQRKGRVLAVILLGIEAALVVLAVLNVLQGADQYHLTNAVLISLVWGLYLLNRFGFVQTASVITVILCAVVPLLLVGGSTVGAYMAMVIPVLVASYLLAPWAGLAMGALMVALAFAFDIASLSLILLVLITTLAYMFAESVRGAERKYRSSFENAVEGIYQSTMEGRLITVNPALARMFGYGAPQEMLSSVSNVWHDLYAHPEQREEVVRHLRQHDSVSGIEGRGFRKDGSEMWFSLSARAVRDNSGKIVRLEGALEDITRRKQTEEQLRQAEARYRTLVERMPAVVYVQEIGSPDAAMYMSPQIEALTGYSPEDCKDPALRWGMVHPDDRERIRLDDSHTGKPGEVVAMEYRLLHRDGRMVWIRNESVLVEDEGSGTRYWQGFIVDITKRKRAEEEMRRARETAEEASRAKSEFLANMSHELRTPMNGVIGMTGLLMDTDLSAEQREYAETIRVSANNLLTIINDVLDFSKIEAGRMDLEVIDFALRDTVEEALGLFVEQVYAKGLELASFIEPGIPDALRGDPGRLTQVLTNLLGNAIKFTEEGEVVLRVFLREETEKDAVVCFSVTDTGIGLTTEQCSRVFQSFTQADASTTRRYGGTGLGLAISKQLVEIMGGEIGLESEQGAGSTFWFTARFEKRPEVARPAPIAVPDLGDLRVLVVDDNETNRKILHEQVVAWGTRSGLAEDGPRALKLLREAAERGEPYDLAVLDMQMPGMDGMQVAQVIKDDPALASVHLILLTSLGIRGDVEAARRLGIGAYLTKPVRQSHLYDAIATVLGKDAEGSAVEKQTRVVTRHGIRDARAASRPRVLVAEDNAVNQRVATKMLETLGYRADVAADGVEAVEAIARVPYAAILMDVQMPEMDGYDATAEVRRRQEGSGHRTPVIAMTANAMKGDRESALEAGMDDYIPKPVKLEELKAILARWVPSEQEVVTTPVRQEATAADGFEEPLDHRVIEDLRDLGGSEMLSELAELFLRDARSAVDTLKGAVARDDTQTIIRVAHTLKGSSGNMGAREIAQVCLELQKVADSGDLASAPGLLARLEEELDRAGPALVALSQGS